MTKHNTNMDLLEIHQKEIFPREISVTISSPQSMVIEDLGQNNTSGKRHYQQLFGSMKSAVTLCRVFLCHKPDCAANSLIVQQSSNTSKQCFYQPFYHFTGYIMFPGR